MEDKFEIFFSKQRVPALFLLQQTAIRCYLLLQLHPGVQENFMLSKLFLNSPSHFQQLFLQAFNLTFQILELHVVLLLRGPQRTFQTLFL